MHQRSDLLDAAAEMVLQRGYAGLRYQDVSAASGVPVASLRHYFPTLERLRKDAVRHLVRTELTLMRDRLQGVVDPWERVLAYVTEAIDLDPDGRRDGWLLWLEYWWAAAHDDELAADAREVHQAWLEMVGETIQLGVDQGIFHVDQPLGEAAREFCAVIDGYGLELVVDHDEAEALAAIAAVRRAVARMLGVPEDVAR